MADNLDFSIFDKITNKAAFEINPPGEAFNSEFDNKDLEEIKESALKEVESLDSFEKETPKEQKKESKKEVKGEETINTEEIEEEESEEDTKASEDPEESVIKGISEWAKTKGIIDYKDDEFEDSEDFLETKLIEKAKGYSEEYKNSLPPVIKELIDNYEDGVPLDYLIDSKSREMEYSMIKKEDLEKDVSKQKQVVSEWLSIQGYTEKEIQKKITKYEDAAMLDEEAQEVLGKLINYETNYQVNLKKEIESRKEADKKVWESRLTKIESDIMSSDEIIKGIKPSKEQKKEIFEAYTKVDSRGKTKLQKSIEADPQAWYKITQFMIQLGGNLDGIEKKIKTKEVQKVKESVNSYVESNDSKSITSKTALSTMAKALKASQKARLQNRD